MGTDTLGGIDYVSLNECIDHGRVGDRDGYARTTRLISGTQYNTSMHRLAFCLYNKCTLDDIEGKIIRHICDNSRCINPEHLLSGTHEDNMRDMVQRNRQCKGSDVFNSTLKLEDVVYIKKMHVKGCRQYGARALGRAFNVTKRAILDIIKGRTWKNSTE